MFVLNHIPQALRYVDRFNRHHAPISRSYNFYIRERIAGEEAAGRASFGPGVFYRLRYGSQIEFVCIDTSKESFSPGESTLIDDRARC